MSESLFYNRDTNLSGITVPSELEDLSLTPVYGSTVEFEGLNHSYITDDFYYNLIPLSVNSLGAKFSVRYEVNETNAQSLVAFFESQSGYLPIKFTPDNSGIYKTVSGFCDNYAVNFINNQHFEVAAGIVVDRAPTLLNWKNGNFANVPFRGWNAGYASFKKYDVVYYRFNPDGTENENKLENFYYCSGDHAPSETNSPTGTSSIWSQKFFFEPDVGAQSDVKIKADVLHYKNSFAQHLKTNDNIATFNMSYTYSNISDRQLRGMLHFLENKGGYRRFEHQIPSVYNRPKVYYCPTWNHTWNYFNSNTLTVDLVEDPLGVIPKAYAGIDPWDNEDANAYISAVEASDSYTFNDPQKGALTDFFNALDTKGLSSKVLKMWLVGFSNEAALRDVINPTVKEAWTDEPAATPDGAGYATYDQDAKIQLYETMGGLGIDEQNCGAFFAGTNMSDAHAAEYVNSYHSATQNFSLGKSEEDGDPGYGVSWRASFATKLFISDGLTNERDGVFIGSRNVGDASLTRIAGGRVAENTTLNVGIVGTTPTNPIFLWGGNTDGDVSTAGITSGLTTAQAETLGGLLYDLCVGIGHTALETQDS